MPSENQKQICDQLEGCLHYSLEDISSLPQERRSKVDELGKHAVLDVIEVDLEAGFPVTVEPISEFKKLRKLRICGIDPIENGYEPIFGFRELQDIVFERTGLDDLSGFSALLSLERFAFYDLTTHESGAEVFGTLPNLKVLQLNDSEIDENELQGISNSQSILDLSFTIGSENFNLSPITKLKQLKYLHVRRTNAVKLDFNCLLKLPQLKRLRLSSKTDADSAILKQMEEKGITVEA